MICRQSRAKAGGRLMSKQPKLTPWFPGDVKPARPGVYQRSLDPCAPIHVAPLACYCMWDGKFWMVYENTPEEAAECRIRSAYQHEWWRGLAEQP